jgi:peptidoglycan L-alanyl-D-glutamate endopeptidase CwlK
MILGKRSRERLIGVHPDLIIVMATAIQRTEIDFAVIEGVRTLKRQKELLDWRQEPLKR